MCCLTPPPGARFRDATVLAPPSQAPPAGSPLRPVRAGPGREAACRVAVDPCAYAAGGEVTVPLSRIYLII